MTNNYILNKNNQEKGISHDALPGDKYEVYPFSVIDYDEFPEEQEFMFFPSFDAKDDIFKEIPDYVWNNRYSKSFLQQLAIIYGEKKNPSLSYTPIRVEKDESFFVLEWLFQDKRISFYFSENEENKYSIICYNAEKKTFINTVKYLSKERYKEIAEEVLSYLT
jgi:hypothetical protein